MVLGLKMSLLVSAEIGGYVGVLLGVSFLHLSKVVWLREMFDKNLSDHLLTSGCYPDYGPEKTTERWRVVNIGRCDRGILRSSLYPDSVGKEAG